MNFYLYDIIFCIIFITFVSIFLYKRRDKIKIEKPFMLYRTQFGIKLIEKIAKKKKLLNFLEKESASRYEKLTRSLNLK